MHKKSIIKYLRKYCVPILVAAIVVSGLTGFGIGRATAGNKAITAADAVDETTIIGGADGETGIYLADDTNDDGDAEAAAQESTEDAEAASTEDADTADTPEETGTDEEDDLVDAADITDTSEIASGNGETYDEIDVGAYSDVDEMNYTEVDPDSVANVTLREAELPDGVASTLWGKTHTGKAAMQIVIFGDSQFGNFLDEDGMAYKLSDKCQANVYNMAIGGTAASISKDDADYNSHFDDTGLCGMIKAMIGDVDADKIFDGYTYQYNVFKSCDFSKTDIFILEYGVNDYFMKTPLFSDDDYEADEDDDNGGKNIRTYNGALKFAVENIRSHYPDAQIMICAPTYAEFFESGTGNLLGNYYSVSNGIGTLEDYVNAAKNIPGDYNNTATFIPVDDMDTKMDYWNADEYLLDGVHLTEKGREEYTQILGRFLIRNMGYSIEEDTDPADCDWRSTLGS